MPRPIWSGSISFGLVTIPVKLYSAVSRKNVRFHQIDSRTNARVRQKRVAVDDVEVPYNDIVKGYELDSGEYVIITEDELAALDPKSQKTIDIDEFVDLADIDPIFYENAYYLAPDKTAKPYALLAKVMEESGKVGLAHFVMRTKQYLAAVRPHDGMLLMSTMVYADEINDPAQIPELADIGDIDLADRELAMARQLVDSLSGEFQPDRFHDTYREEVLALIERKAGGQEAVAPAGPAEPAKVIDLMAALEASVTAAKEARKRHPTGRPADAAEMADGTADQKAEEVADQAGDGVGVSPRPATKTARKSAASAPAAKKSAGKGPAKQAPTKKAPAKKAAAKKAPAKRAQPARKTA